MHDFSDVSANEDTKNYRIFCDCEGTLFGLANGKKINVVLIEFLVEAQKNGYEVQIFSDDPSGNNLMLRMSILMLQKDRPDLVEFLEGITIDHKNAHAGDKAVIIFDDNHSTHRSISANLLAPDDICIPEMTKRLKESNVSRAPLFSGNFPANG